METPELNVVTGAFGYTGKYITQRLLAAGKRLKTLTDHPARSDPFGGQVACAPYNFQNPGRLTDSLRGAAVLYNTYWIRFSRGGLTFDQALENSRTLVKAAGDAGVRRIVHLSIANPSPDSSLPYYHGKAAVEDIIKKSPMSYAILRPTVIFGREGILINNIAWMLRHLPVFGTPGNGEYKLQPVFIEDLADLAVAAGSSNENKIFDAVGPEVFTFNELLRQIAEKIRVKARIIHLPTLGALAFCKALGLLLRDVILTRDEVKGLKANLLASSSTTPTGKTKLTDWLTQNADWLGTKYFSELKKHYV